MTNPSKKKALDFLGSGEEISKQATGGQALKSSPKIDKNSLISALNVKNKTEEISEQATGAQALKSSPKIDKSPLISALNAKNKTTAVEILDFFGSKRTEERLRGSVKRLRNSLVNTFDIAALLKTVILGITKKLADAPNKLKGQGGGGLLGFLKNGIIKLIGGLGAKILGILGGIVSFNSWFRWVCDTCFGSWWHIIRCRE